MLGKRDEYRSGLDLASAEPLNADLLEKLLESLLPPENKEDVENYAVLLKELADFNVKSAGQLRRIIQRHKKDALHQDALRVSSEEKDKLTSKQRERLVDKSVYFTHVGLARVAMEKEYGERWKNYMWDLAIQHMKKMSGTKKPKDES